jgi:hypothetical protein
MRTCRVCSKEKQEADFYACRAKDGKEHRMRVCVGCYNAKGRERRMARIEEVREYDRKRAKTTAWRIRSKALNESWKKRNPDKARAHNYLHFAVRVGMVVRRPCEVCGSSEHVHAHHDDYSKPIEVRWLCAAHHSQVHHASRTTHA